MKLSAMCLGALAVSGCGLGARLDSSAPERDTGAKATIGESHALARPGVAPAAGDAIGVRPALEADLTNFKSRLVGLSPERIDALFGAPSFARAEPPATIWQYRRPDCTIDIFLYEAGGITRVDHVDVRGARDGAVDEQTCFKENLQKRIAAGAQGG